MELRSGACLICMRPRVQYPVLKMKIKYRLDLSCRQSQLQAKLALRDGLMTIIRPETWTGNLWGRLSRFPFSFLLPRIHSSQGRWISHTCAEAHSLTPSSVPQTGSPEQSLPAPQSHPGQSQPLSSVLLSHMLGLMGACDNRSPAVLT